MAIDWGKDAAWSVAHGPLNPGVTVNGSLFFTELEGLLVQAHDRGLVNENALRDVLKELVDGHPLTVPMLMQIFGTPVIFQLRRKDGR